MGLIIRRPWSPRHTSKTKSWLPAFNTTSVSGGIVDPSDISTGNWTKNFTTTPTPNTLMDTSDGSDHYHFVYQMCPDIVLGGVNVVDFELKAGTKTWAQIIAGDNAYINVNLNTGAHADWHPGITSCVATPRGGGGYNFRVTTDGPSVINNRVSVWTALDEWTNSYTGDGTGSIFVYKIQLVGGSLTVSDVNDPLRVSSITQSTPANRPALLVGANGRKYIKGDGSDDYLQGAISGLGSPVLVCLCAKWDAAYSSNDVMCDNNTSGNMQFGRTSDTSIYIKGSSSFAYNSATALSLHSYCLYYNGASSVIYEDGVSVATGDAGTTNSDGVTFFADRAGATPSPASIYDYAVFAYVDSATAQSLAIKWKRYCHKWYGSP